MRQLEGRRALVTGAAAGIGRALALALARRGMHLWLADIDAPGLLAATAEVRELGVDAEPLLADLARPADIDDLARQVLASRCGVDLLVNNAGIGLYGGTHHMTDEQWDQLMAVNLEAPIRLTRRLLAHMRQRPEAHIANMCSIAGLVAGGRFTAYHTSKFGLLGFTLALRAEYTRKGLGVTAICPGPCRTNLYKRCGTVNGTTAAEPPRWISTTPEAIAEATVRGILKNRRLVLVTPLAHFLYQVNRFCPGVIDFAHTVSHRQLPWYRGKPLHVPTIGLPEQEPAAATEADVLPFPQTVPPAKRRAA